MRKMLINASESEEIRVAIVEGSILEEYYVERMSVESCLGNVYKGRVTNVEPSIGAAFIEFGGPRHGFLHVSDIMDEVDETAASLARARNKAASASAAALPATPEGDDATPVEAEEVAEGLPAGEASGTDLSAADGPDDPAGDPGLLTGEPEVGPNVFSEPKIPDTDEGDASPEADVEFDDPDGRAAVEVDEDPFGVDDAEEFDDSDESDESDVSDDLDDDVDDSDEVRGDDLDEDDESDDLDEDDDDSDGLDDDDDDDSDGLDDDDDDDDDSDEDDLDDGSDEDDSDEDDDEEEEEEEEDGEEHDRGDRAGTEDRGDHGSAGDANGDGPGRGERGGRSRRGRRGRKSPRREGTGEEAASEDDRQEVTPGEAIASEAGEEAEHTGRADAPSFGRKKSRRKPSRKSGGRDDGGGKVSPPPKNVAKAPARPSRDGSDARDPQPSGVVRPKSRQIMDHVKKGQEVVVQVTKDGIGTKGPTLTTYLSLPGRFLVLMPGMERRGVSRKIEDAKERDRLKKVLDQLEVRDDLGFIVRTAGIGQTQRALQKDLNYLTQLWEKIENGATEAKAPALLYHESDLVIRTIRDIYTSEMGDIIVDCPDAARRAREFLAVVMPRAATKVKLYNGERPLFTAYGIEEEIGRLFQHRVELKSGGSLVIEQTEALVAIDVNSGRFREEGDLEETAFKINLEAAEAISQHLRLRDLGGVIVLDFIDMRSDKRRRAVEKAFRSALRADRSRIKVGRMSMFGTIEMTRQRVRASLRQSIFQRCPSCRGVGYVATLETLHLNLIREVKLLLARKNRGLDIYLNQENAEFLFNERRERLVQLEKDSGKTIRVHLEPELRPDEWRVVPVGG